VTQGKTESVVSYQRWIIIVNSFHTYVSCNIWTVIFQPAKIDSHVGGTPFVRLSSVAAKLELFHWERSHPSSTPWSLLRPRLRGIMLTPVRDIPREWTALVPFEARKRCLQAGQDGRRRILINNMPRTIERSHYRGNTRSNVNLFFGGSWSVTWWATCWNHATRGPSLVKLMCTVYAAEMHLCQLMFIGDAELAGDLFEIAGLLVSEINSSKIWRKVYCHIC